MRTTPLHQNFGVEIHDVDLRQIGAGTGYDEIRAAFDAHSLLLFRGQNLTDEEHLAFAALFGPLEDREDRPEPKIEPVSNVRADGSIAAEHDVRTLNLKANQLWHTDSTFLPVPALANVLQARVVTSTGGETEFVSTRAGWARLEPALKARIAERALKHHYTHSRARIDPALAGQKMFNKWPVQTWKAQWRNPANGETSLYIASHAFAVDGLAEDESQALIDALIDAVTTEDAIYSHRWAPGDVIIWDERATLHRGRPWPYEEPRTLVSICVSARNCDGLDTIRAH